MEHTSLLFWRMEPKSGFLRYVSKNIRILLEYEPSELINQPVGPKLIPAEDFPQLITQTKLLVQNNQNLINLENRAYTKSQKLRWFDTRIWFIRADDGSLLYLDGISMDITDIKETEQLLQYSESRSQVIARKSSDLIFEYDFAMNHFIWFGDIQFLHEYGWTTAPESVQELMDYILPEDHAQCKHFFSSEESTQPINYAGFRMFTDFGRIGYFKLMGKRKSIQNSLKLIGSISDHTLATYYQQELDLRKSMGWIGNLVQGSTHDLNNILSIITANLSLLQSEAKNFSSNQQLLIDETIQASLRAANEIKNLYSFTQSDKHLQKKIDLYDIVQQIMDFLDHSTNKLIQKSHQLTSGKFLILGNPIEINQVIFNLVLNSVEAITEKGVTATDFVQITGEILQLDPALVDIQLQYHRIYTPIHENVDGKPFIHLKVHDSGGGMPPENLENLFRPFYSTKQQRGAKSNKGLGLAICYNIVNLKHRGFLQVENYFGKGMVFHVFFPQFSE